MSDVVKNHMTSLPHSVNKEADLAKAEEMMREFNCHHLPVLDGGHLVGMITEHDLQLRKASEDPAKVKVADFMMPDPISVESTTSIKDAIRTMVDHNIHSLIVNKSNDSEWGIFTATNALTYCADKLD